MYCNLKHGVTLHLQFANGITAYFEKLNVRRLQAEKVFTVESSTPAELTLLFALDCSKEV
jgi:hypothetical protein